MILLDQAMYNNNNNNSNNSKQCLPKPDNRERLLQVAVFFVPIVVSVIKLKLYPNIDHKCELMNNANEIHILRM